MSNTQCVIFGGSGFIGQHFAVHLIDNEGYSSVLLADIVAPDPKKTSARFETLLTNGTVTYQHCDVRQPIELNYQPDLIANFAAIHREPGHKLEEYYDTNLPGATHVCNWATQVGCNQIIFTSSIAPYGPTEEPVNENSIPHPVSGYGGSKLAAEGIHKTWQAANHSRKLVIVRPGVVFGAGEGGNVTRLIRAYLKGYFFYMGNQKTRKSGTYVKELCNAMTWMLQNGLQEGFCLFNMSMNPPPSVEDYVNAIQEVSGVKRKVLSAPYPLLYTASLVIGPLARLLKISQPIDPVRLRKLVKSNNIEPMELTNSGYPCQYDLSSAMRDWKKEKGVEWPKI